MSDSTSRDLQFRIASDQALMVYFDAPTTKGAAETLPPQIAMESHEQVRRLLRLLELDPIQGVRNLHPAYSSILIQFDGLKLQHEVLQQTLRGYAARMQSVALPSPRQVEVPVCYGGEHGPDLKAVAQLHSLTEAQAIELHSSATYIVYFLGFAPGFAYLGDVAEQLATPRLPSPRKSVPAGSVGIAGRQTGVYPIATPGGWRLLGRTPVKMFQPDRAQMSLLAIGDRVRFVPISQQQFAKLAAERA